MNDLERLHIERACERLVTDYTHLVDEGRASAVADLFTDDGVWSSPEVTMEGQAKIREGFARREAMDRTSKHVCTNVGIDVHDADHASGLVYLSLYRADGVGDGPGHITGPSLIGHYEDTFVRTEAGWRFRTRSTHVTFVS